MELLLSFDSKEIAEQIYDKISQKDTDKPLSLIIDDGDIRINQKILITDMRIHEFSIYFNFETIKNRNGQMNTVKFFK